MAAHAQKLRQGRPPLQERIDRKTCILDTALRLFAAQGIAGTTVAQIARAAQVTPAMIHYYFGNRDGLVEHLVRERLAPCLHHIWLDMPEEDLRCPRRMICGLVDRLLDVVEKIPELPDLWSREILNAGGQLRHMILEHFPRGRLEQITQHLSHAQGQGLLNSKVHPALTLTSIIAVVMLPLAGREVLQQAFAASIPGRQTLRRHAIALLLDGLCLPAASTDPASTPDTDKDKA
ncbi:MAG: TetR/AcrR family transcriptional regulator [Desulfovibrio sp.]|nr:TetR/AcrR family transcriptional regulator [Desulfovibrio sp.]